MNSFLSMPMSLHDRQEWLFPMSLSVGIVALTTPPDEVWGSVPGVGSPGLDILAENGGVELSVSKWHQLGWTNGMMKTWNEAFSTFWAPKMVGLLPNLRVPLFSETTKCCNMCKSCFDHTVSPCSFHQSCWFRTQFGRLPIEHANSGHPGTAEKPTEPWISAKATTVPLPTWHGLSGSTSPTFSATRARGESSGQSPAGLTGTAPGTGPRSVYENADVTCRLYQRLSG